MPQLEALLNSSVTLSIVIMGRLRTSKKGEDESNTSIQLSALVNLSARRNSYPIPLPSIEDSYPRPNQPLFFSSPPLSQLPTLLPSSLSCPPLSISFNPPSLLVLKFIPSELVSNYEAIGSGEVCFYMFFYDDV